MLLYVAGPYRGDVDRNIAQARSMAVELYKAGHNVITPHMNTAKMDEDTGLPDQFWLDATLELLARCDGIVMSPDWEKSEGAKSEHSYAQEHDIPIWYFPDIPSLHVTEKRCPRQCKAFLTTVMTMYRLHLSKNSDYSPANILGAGEIGVLVRLWDKIARLMNLAGFRINIASSSFEAPRDPKHEAIEDTLIDAANYAVIGLLVRCGLWGK